MRTRQASRADPPQHAADTFSDARKDTAPVRRSRRIAARENEPLPPHYTPPPAPKLDASPKQFDGPQPTWVTDEREHTRVPASPRGEAPEPHRPPPLRAHALHSMPQDGGVAGIGISFPLTPKAKRSHARNLSEATRRDVEARGMSSARSSPNLAVDDEWASPVDAAKVPDAPHLGPLERGTFSPTRLPEPVSKLVEKTHPDADVPKRRASNYDMSRTHTMRREMAIVLDSLEKMPKDDQLAGLGIVMANNKSEKRTDDMSAVLENMQHLSLKNKGEPKRKVFGERSLNAQLSAMSVSEKESKTTSLGKEIGKGGSVAWPPHRSVLDENGKPVAYKAPTKRYTIPPVRKPRSSVAAPQVMHDRTSFAVSCSFARPAPQAPSVPGNARKALARFSVPLR